VFITVNLAVISMSFSLGFGSDTSRFEYRKVVYDKPCLYSKGVKYENPNG
jgi:hypothetical protein